MSQTYSLRERSDGRVEIVHVVPTVMAMFYRRDDAQRVIDLLNGAGEPQTKADVKETTGAAVDSQVLEQPQPDRSFIAPVVAFPPEPAMDAEVQEPVAAPPVPSLPVAVAQPVAEVVADQEPDWEAAMARLADGEALRAVADDLGMSWTALRGKWAQRSKTRDTSVDGKVACSICERPFLPSDRNPDKCARCSRD